MTNVWGYEMDKNIILKQTSDNLKKLLESKAEALPKAFNETRFLQNCLTVLSETKNIERMEPRSIARTMLKGAFLGLDFISKECYAIPYGNELTFQTSYVGEIKLVQLYSIRKILSFYANLVRKGDDFSFQVVNGRQIVNHEPLPFNNEPVVGAYAVASYEDGGYQVEVMSAEEIDAVRTRYSKVPNGPAWKNSPGEMQKKTVLRRLCKMIQLNFDNSEQQEAFEEASGMDVKKQTVDAVASVPNPFMAKPEPVSEPKTEAKAEEATSPEPKPEKTAWEEEDELAKQQKTQERAEMEKEEWT